MGMVQRFQRKQLVVLFSPQQAPYVPPFVPPTSPTFVPASVGPTMNVGLDPNFQTMMMEMMRQNSRLIELMDRRLTAEEKRREEEEVARKAATTPYVGPIGDRCSRIEQLNGTSFRP